MRLKEIAGFLLVSVTVAVMVCALLTTVSAQSTEDSIRAMMADINAQLEGMGENVRLAVVDYNTSADSGEMGQTVYAHHRDKQLGHHFIPGDPLRFGDTDIKWAIDKVDKTGDLVQVDVNAAIERAMDTWDSVQCSTIPLTRVDDFGLDLGYVQWLVGLGGVPGWLADITHAGWLPRLFFDIIGGPGGGDYILGVTFTFVWIDDNDDPTDMDNNGKEDVAFREIYYNDEFDWLIDGRNFDVESVVLHEVGHGLSQGHFGKIFRTKNGKLHFAPRAVMNAIYYDIQQELKGTDVGGHCSIWGAWPNK
jgi:hypothetical protein